MNPDTNGSAKVITALGPCPNPPDNSPIVFSYPTDHFQNHAFHAIEAGQHVLVTAHTGAGKTTVAEYAIAHAINKHKRVFYTAPIKALSNQVFADLKRKHNSWNIGIRTGDIDFNSEQSQVLIMTTEILLNMLYRSNDKETEADVCVGADADADARADAGVLDNVAVVIFDEIHYIKDHARGHVWEKSIMMLPNHIQMVMLSATLPDAHSFCTWIAECKHATVTHTTTDKRPVPLTHYVMTERDLVPIMDGHNFNDRAYTNAFSNYAFNTAKLNEYIPRIQLPALFFCFSKKLCQTYAHYINLDLTTSTEKVSIQNNIHHLIRKFPNYNDLLNIPQTIEVFKLAYNGICYHHAGLFPHLKEIIQQLFADGLIKILFVTETFAAGVNLPAKSVVFTSLQKYDDMTHNFRVLLPEEYSQMAGRAGRRGIDTAGSVILLPFNLQQHPPVRDVKHMMSGDIHHITPKIKSDYTHVLNSLRHNTDILATGSMQDRNNQLALKQYLSQLSEHEKRLDELLESLDDDVSDEFYNKLNEYRAWSASHGRPDNSSLRSARLRDWYLNNKQLCDLTLNIMQLQDDIEEINHQIQIINDDLFLSIRDVLLFLQHLGYVSDTVQLEQVQLKVTDLTTKGIVAADIHETNPILLTEIITNHLLDDLDHHALAAVLASILPHTEKNMGDYDLPPYITNLIMSIQTLADDLSLKESQNLQFSSEWNVNLELANMAYQWSKTHKLYTGDMQPGDCVRAILKLHNLAKETLNASQVLQYDTLAVQLRLCIDNLIHGVVSPHSLYIS